MFSSNTTQVVASGVASAATFTNRTDLSTAGFREAYDSVASSSTTAYAVGTNGVVMKSTDSGLTWSYNTSLIRASGWGSAVARALAYSGSLFVAAGDSGKVATSTDGTTWTYSGGLASTDWGSSNVNSIVWTGSQFVAVGDSGKVATSTDGTTWTNQTGLSSTAWSTTNANKVIFANSLLVAVGDSGKVATSSDGVTWANQTGLSSTAWSTTNARSIAYANSKYIVVGDSGKVATSTDGATWTNSTTLSSSAWGTTDIYHVTSDGTFWLVSGMDGKLAYSVNQATSWSSTNSSLQMVGRAWRTAVWFSSTSGRVALVDVYLNVYSDPLDSNATLDFKPVFSVANVSFETFAADTSRAINRVVYGDRFVAVGNSGLVMTSTDGKNWQVQTQLTTTAFGTNNILAIIWDGSQYIIGGGGGMLATSSDGATWTANSALTTTTFGTNIVRGLSKGSTNYCAIADSGIAAYTTTPGSTWTYASGLTTSGFSTVYDILWHSGTSNMIVHGVRSSDSTGIIARCTQTFTSQALSTTYNSGFGVNYPTAGGVASSGSVLVAKGGSGVAMRSTDGGFSWTAVTIGGANSHGGPVMFDGTRWYSGTGGALDGNVYYSADATGSGTWTSVTSSIANTTTFGAQVSLVKSSTDYMLMTASGYTSTSTTPTTSPWTRRSSSRLPRAKQGTTALTAVVSVNDVIYNSASSSFLLTADNARLVLVNSTNNYDLVNSLAANASWGVVSNHIVYCGDWNGSQWIVAGQGGKVATSPDGITWTFRNGLQSTGWSTTAVRKIFWNGSQYLAIGDGGKTATSADGVTWTYTGANLIATTWSTSIIRSGVWTGSQYVIVGDAGKAATSPDGATWTYQGAIAASTWGANNVLTVSFNGSKLVAGGNGGRIATSTDGVSWSYVSNLISTSWGTGGNVEELTWDGTRFIAVGTAGRSAYSLDGATWVYSTNLTTAWGGTGSNALGLAAGNGQFIVAGTNSKSAIGV